MRPRRWRHCGWRLQREQAGGKAGKLLQLLELGGRRKCMRLAVEHAECADAGAGHHHRRAHVEADVLPAGDQRIAGEARVEGGVGYHHRLVAGGDRMGAEGYFGRRFGLIEADTGFEPLPLGIYQGDQRDRSMHDGRGKAADAIEVRISCCVERIEAMEDGSRSGAVTASKTSAGRAGAFSTLLSTEPPNTRVCGRKPPCRQTRLPAEPS
ncbi:hypothetical protein AJ88_45390 [Mesorhizobium amorphae CCBAU 01583]|nr:hypothetical protein AJ88_45390 [Mesorhizobium amorphae CCBAU 01583]